MSQAGAAPWKALPQRRRRKRQRPADAPAATAASSTYGTPAAPFAERERKFEYLDHTADIQLHSWGETKAEAFEQAALAMFGYMTELESVEHDRSLDAEIEVRGHDLLSLLFAFLDELLFRFSAEDHVCCDVRITSLDETEGACCLRATCLGERFALGKHPQGTEVKAITYSNMQIVPKKGSGAHATEIFVIVDI